MEEKELNFDEEMMPCEEALEKEDDENITENRENNIQKIISKIFKRKTNNISKEHKDKKDEKTDNENDEGENIESMNSELSKDTKEENMYERWWKEENDKRYKIRILIGKYYDKHIQELEESINKKDELINKIYEITERY
ncbi:hypothetical protein [uncultured Sneathia sp.]|uniref:hypothetical protein n=1 Tax=uncultured Sneathia sp. TaxID=278067 RepID=UPI00259BE202|nr:hypothetical protein [uncultured Sneathia sp.]